MLTDPLTPANGGKIAQVAVQTDSLVLAIKVATHDCITLFVIFHFFVSISAVLWELLLQGIVWTGQAIPQIPSICYNRSAAVNPMPKSDFLRGIAHSCVASLHYAASHDSVLVWTPRMWCKKRSWRHFAAWITILLSPRFLFGYGFASLRTSAYSVYAGDI
jgi:hypothetical protein